MLLLGPTLCWSSINSFSCFRTTSTQVVPVLPQRKVGTPLLLLIPCGPRCATCPLQPAASAVPLPAPMAEQPTAVPGGPGLGAAPGHAVRLPRDPCRCTRCSAPSSFFPTRLWVRTRGPAGALRCSPRGSDDGVGVERLHAPRGHGCLCPRGSGEPWPGTPTLSHSLRQVIWSDQSETRGSVWVSTKIPSGSCCVGSRCCCVPRGYTVCRDAGSC